MKTRRFVIKCLNEQVCFDLLNKITEEVSSRFMRTEVKKNMLIIEALGLPYELKELRYQIEQLKRELEAKYMPTTRIKLSELPKLARATVPTDALLEALKLLGYSPRIEGDALVVDAPAEEVLELVRRMRSVYDSEVVRFRLPHSLKKAVAVLSAVYGVDPEEVVKEMEEEGLIELGDFKYEMREDWKKIIKEMRRVLSAY